MNSLSTPIRNQIQLVVAPHAGRDMMLALASRLAPVALYGCWTAGISSMPTPSRAKSAGIRRTQPCHEQHPSLARLPCYQMVVLLADTPPSRTARCWCSTCSPPSMMKAYPWPKVAVCWKTPSSTCADSAAPPR